MSRSKKQKPLDAFCDSMDDADALITYAKAFQNQRTKSMRIELRDRVGEALRVPVRDRDAMDCIDNGHVFLVFRNSNELGRENFSDLRPLLRQSIVAGCAALETYLADKVMEYVGSALKSEAIPRRLREISLTIGHWLYIESYYSRKKWGVRTVIDEAVREQASTAPTKVGELLSMVGITGWAKKVDSIRKVKSGDTEDKLRQITNRRNRIAHSADRVGQGRAHLDIDEAESYLASIRQIAETIDTVVDTHAI